MFTGLSRAVHLCIPCGDRNCVCSGSYGVRILLFVSERGGPLTARAVHHIVLRAGKIADLSFPIHPHMFRHACGFYLANRGFDTRAIQQYLGHCNIQHTVRYTTLTPHRFVQFWDD